MSGAVGTRRTLWDFGKATHHKSNRQLVQSKKCWAQVLSTLNLINNSIGPDAADRIAINFGEWETETSQDPNALGATHMCTTS